MLCVMSDRWYFDTIKRVQWSGKIFQKIYVVLTSCHEMIGGEEQGKEDSNFYKLFWRQSCYHYIIPSETEIERFERSHGINRLLAFRTSLLNLLSISPNICK